MTMLEMLFLECPACGAPHTDFSFLSFHVSGGEQWSDGEQYAQSPMPSDADKIGQCARCGELFWKENCLRAPAHSLREALDSPGAFSPELRSLAHRVEQAERAGTLIPRCEWQGRPDEHEAEWDELQILDWRGLLDGRIQNTPSQELLIRLNLWRAYNTLKGRPLGESPLRWVAHLASRPGHYLRHLVRRDRLWSKHRPDYLRNLDELDKLLATSDIDSIDSLALRMQAARERGRFALARQLLAQLAQQGCPESYLRPARRMIALRRRGCYLLR